MTEPRADVCVVGGGPAGLTLALLMLRSGATVTVVERARSLHREYRGEILQPGGMRILDQLGVLAGARSRGGYELSRFQLVDRGRALLDVDYRRLPGPHNHLLSLPQEHLMAELLDRCHRYDGFTYLPGARLATLVREGGRVVGAEVDGADGRREVRARCVVGADGRYSKTRQLAQIDNRRFDVFDLDVLWFKVPNPDGPTGRVRVLRAEGSAVLAYDSYPGCVQIGWTLPHGGYRKRGGPDIAQIKASAQRHLPEFADAIEARITGLTDLTLLDVFAARAHRWSDDGLLLIGDAAHTHSPLGAQGINLAIQDAAAAHPVLLDALRTGEPDARSLAAFERGRGEDIDAVMKFQIIQSRGMFGGGLAGFLRPKLAGVLMHTPLGTKVLRHIAVGNPGIRVRTDLLTQD
jgi:6-methylpretetramide 4-monooxygenase